MFDIGFAELVVIAVVGLLVIGPERLPETIRTLVVWLNRLKRGISEIRQEVERELHNDAVMQELRETEKQIREQADDLGRDFKSALETLPGPGDAERPNNGTGDPGKTGE